MSELLQLYP